VERIGRTGRRGTAAGSGVFRVFLWGAAKAAHQAALIHAVGSQLLTRLGGRPVRSLRIG
jgi:hypothetical protein